MKRFLICFFGFLFWSSPAWAMDYFVSGLASSNGDGLTYETAGNSVGSGDWNFSPQSGDTVYICDTFTNASMALQDLAGVTIRGDYPGHPGVIIGMFYRWEDGWSDEGDGTYSRTFTGYNATACDFALEDDATAELLRMDSRAECISTAGTFYQDTGTNTLYYHPSDASGANDHVFSIYEQVSSIRSGCDGITVTHLSFRGGPLRMQYIPPPADPEENADIDDSVFSYLDFKWIGFYGCLIFYHWPFDNVEVHHCNFEYMRAGIYLLTGVGGSPQTNFYIHHNTGAHTAHAEYTTTDEDDHFIATQGCIGCRIEHNSASDVTNGFAVYCYEDVPFYNNEIAFNYFKNGHDAQGAGQESTALLDSTTSGSSAPVYYGNKYHHNIIDNFKNGARPNLYQTEYFYNNVFYNCIKGIKVFRGVTLNTDFLAENNIFYNCTYPFYNASGATSNYSYVMRYNLYTAGSLFYTGYGNDEGDFDWWITQTAWGTGTLVPDTTGSLVGDPSFLNAGGNYDIDTDFKIDSNSDAIDAGNDIGLFFDYWGDDIDDKPDIGIDEFKSEGSSPSPSITRKGKSMSGVIVH